MSNKNVQVAKTKSLPEIFVNAALHSVITKPKINVFLSTKGDVVLQKQIKRMLHNVTMDWLLQSRGYRHIFANENSSDVLWIVLLASLSSSHYRSKTVIGSHRTVSISLPNNETDLV